MIIVSHEISMPPSALLSRKMRTGIQLHEIFPTNELLQPSELNVSGVVNVQVNPVFILV